MPPGNRSRVRARPQRRSRVEGRRSTQPARRSARLVRIYNGDPGLRLDRRALIAVLRCLDSHAPAILGRASRIAHRPPTFNHPPSPLASRPPPVFHRPSPITHRPSPLAFRLPPPLRPASCRSPSSRMPRCRACWASARISRRGSACGLRRVWARSRRGRARQPTYSTTQALGQSSGLSERALCASFLQAQSISGRWWRRCMIA